MGRGLEVTIRREAMVTPSEATPERILWNSNVDLVIPRMHTQSVYFYRNEEGSPEFLSHQTLATALAKTLVPFYPMAGRLRRSSEAGRVEINCNAQGVLLVEAQADAVVADFGEFAPDPRFKQLVPQVDYSQDIASFPLLVLQVTFFKCGGASLGVGMQHHIADGMSGIHCINTWSEMARGIPLRVQPFIDRTLLKANSPPAPKYPHIEYQPPPRLLQRENGHGNQSLRVANGKNSRSRHGENGNGIHVGNGKSPGENGTRRVAGNGTRHTNGNSNGTNGSHHDTQNGNSTNGSHHDTQNGNGANGSHHDKQNGNGTNGFHHDKQDGNGTNGSHHDKQNGNGTNGFHHDKQDGNGTNGSHHDTQNGNSTNGSHHDTQNGNGANGSHHDKQNGNGTNGFHHDKQDGNGTNGSHHDKQNGNGTNGFHHDKQDGNGTNGSHHDKQNGNGTNGFHHDKQDGNGTNGSHHDTQNGNSTNGSHHDTQNGNGANGSHHDKQNGNGTNGFHHDKQDGNGTNGSHHDKQNGNGTNGFHHDKQDGNGTNGSHHDKQNGNGTNGFHHDKQDGNGTNGSHHDTQNGNGTNGFHHDKQDGNGTNGLHHDNQDGNGNGVHHGNGKGNGNGIVAHLGNGKSSGHGEKLTNGKSVQEDAAMAVRVFRFTKEQLATLKQMGRTDDVLFSSYEMLSGHIWKCVTQARELDDAQETKLFVATDGRSRLVPPLPPGYFGNVIFTCTPIASAGELVHNPVTYAARKIHDALSRMNDEYLRSALDYLELQEDVSKLVRGAHHFNSPNLGITSWARMPVYECDFGWGRPVFMGPAAIAYEGLAFVLSSPVADGSLSLSLGLRPDHMATFEKLVLAI